MGYSQSGYYIFLDLSKMLKLRYFHIFDHTKRVFLRVGLAFLEGRP